MLVIRVFKLPLDTVAFNKIMNASNVSIMEKKVFDPDKQGDVTVYLEYEVADDE